MSNFSRDIISSISSPSVLAEIGDVVANGDLKSVPWPIRITPLMFLSNLAGRGVMMTALWPRAIKPCCTAWTCSFTPPPLVMLYGHNNPIFILISSIPLLLGQEPPDLGGDEWCGIFGCRNYCRCMDVHLGAHHRHEAEDEIGREHV